MLNLSKLIAWKFFQHRIRWILCLFCVVLAAGAACFYFLQGTRAYPFIEPPEYADEYNVLLDDPRFAVKGDFDGDGNLDLAVVNFRSSYISIVINNGDGTFKDAVHYSSGGIGPLGIAAGNFDGDADLDLAVVNYITLGTTLANVQIFINNGLNTGVFSAGASYTGFNRPSAIVADYFDADGVLDLAVTNTGSDNFSILLGNGVGGFGAATNFSCGVNPISLISADLNNDGNKDLAIVNVGTPPFFNNRISIHLNNPLALGSFIAGAVLVPPSAGGTSHNYRSVVAGNFDADVDLELVAAETVLSEPAIPSRVVILENDGSGSFTAVLDANLFSEWISSITAGDFDNDAVLDVAVNNFVDNTVSVLSGNGDRTFDAAQNFNVGDGPIYLLTGDFDNDSNDDIITINKGENNPSLPVDYGDIGNNSFSYLRNNYGIKISQIDRDPFVSEQGITDSYDIVLASAPANDVVITFTYNDAQIDLFDASDNPILNGGFITFTSLNWGTPQTIKIVAEDDGVAEGEHFSLITHSSASVDTNFNLIKIPNVNVKIADNDQPGVVIYETDGFTKVTEGGSISPFTDTYNVVLETAPTDNVNIAINSGLQMIASPSNLTFTAGNWNAPQTVTLAPYNYDPDVIDPYNDPYIEGLELWNVSHTASSSDSNYNGIAISAVSVKLIDDNQLPHHPLCPGMTGDLVYNYQVNGLDYQRIVEMVGSIPPYDFCADVNTEAFIGPGDLNDFRSYILGNYYEEPEVVIAEDSGATNVVEGGATDKYIVYLRRKPVVDVYVNIDTNSQLTTDESQLIFTPLHFGESQEVTVTAINDSYIEASPHLGVITHTEFSADPHYSPATFRVINTLDPTGDLFLGINTVTANITDNDVAGIIVTPSGGTTDVNETGSTSDTVNIRLSADPALGSVTINLSSPDGQTIVLPVSLVFTPDPGGNWNIDQPITITAVDDTANETSPHIGMVAAVMPAGIINPVGWRNTTSYIDVNITDNDAPPTISIDDVAALEDDGLIIFTVSLSAASGMQVTVLYDIADGTATVVGNDYVDFPQDLLVFNPGEDTKTISVTVNGDINPEPNETFYINLSGAVNATITDAQGLGTILDDDTGGITVSAISGNTTESGGTATFTVVLDRLPTADVTIGISSSDITEGTVLPDSLTFTALDWDTPQTVTVTGVDDSDDDGNISYIILTANVVSADPAYSGLNPTDVAVINIDNDGEPLGGTTSLYAPANLTCEAVDLTVNNAPIKAINWDFTYNNDTEIGFRLYGVGLIRDVATPDITQIQEPDVTQDPITGLLGVNQAYTRTVKAYNNSIESADSNEATCYTLANAPKQVILSNITADSLTLKLDPNDGNPPETLYAIMVVSGPTDSQVTNYVDPQGNFSPTPSWHTYAEFGGANGVLVTGDASVTGASVQMALTSGENYCFSTQAQNGDGIPTDPSASSCSISTPPVTQSNITALKGVAINLAWNSNLGLFSTAWAGDKFIINANEPLSRVLGVFAWLLNISLIILLIIFALSLQQSLKHLKHEFKYPETFKLIRLILSGEATDSYQKHAQQTEDGIFNKSSYHWHKTLHNLSQGTFIGAMALVGLKLMILGALVAGLINLNHTSLAQNEPYNQSNTPVEEGDVLTYIIEVKNNITATAQDAPVSNATVSDILDSNLENLIVTGLSNCGDYADNSTATTLNISGIDVAIGTTCFITFTADVKIGSEGNTIINQAQVLVNGDTIPTNQTSNPISMQVLTNANQNTNQQPTAVCGNRIIEPGEACDYYDCANGQSCTGSCQCEQPINGNINQPQPFCGNGIIETGEICDILGCATDQQCVNCQCASVIPTNANENINQTPTNININQAPTNGNINQPPVVLPTGEQPTQILIIGPIIDSWSDLLRILAQIEPFKSLNEIILDNPQVEQASQNVVTPILLGVSVFSLLPAVLFSTLYLLPFLHLIFLEPFLLLFGKKRKKWGIVYNSLTKLPVDLALVRLYRQENNQLIQTKVTDKEGRYIIIAKEPGKYYLSVTRPGFISPSKYLQGEQQDLKYLDLYHGEAIEVTAKDAVITANIPLDPAEKIALPIADVIRSYFVKNLRLIVSYIGIILALVVVIIVPTIITIGALLLHILLFMAFRRLIAPAKPKNWGIVYDQNNKKPLPNSIVRIFDIKFNKLLETQVTDSHGRYAFLVGQNEYQMLMEKPGYQNKEVKPVDLVKNQEIVNLDVGLNKV